MTDWEASINTEILSSDDECKKNQSTHNNSYDSTAASNKIQGRDKTLKQKAESKRDDKFLEVIKNSQERTNEAMSSLVKAVTKVDQNPSLDHNAVIQTINLLNQTGKTEKAEEWLNSLAEAQLAAFKASAAIAMNSLKET